MSVAFLFVRRLTVLQVWVFILQLCQHMRGILGFSSSQNRRDFISKGALISIPGALEFTSGAPNSLAADIPDHKDDYNEAVSLFDAKSISWSSKADDEKLSWNKSRYRSSTLSTISKDYAPSSKSPVLYPEWMEGFWAINYKFIEASFPQGRKVLSLRTAGAGIGTCLSLPNVGNNPPLHAVHYLKVNDNGSDGNSASNAYAYEDLAYNLPRRFEAFWPESKVLSVQTDGHPIRDNASKDDEYEYQSRMSPKCFVTGDGCTKEENINLHSPASRVAMDFDGPTRKSGRLTQSCDVTLIDSFGGYKNGDSSQYATVKWYSQFNANQELQTFYKEIMSFEQLKDGILGRVRVAGFLPTYIKDIDPDNKAVYDDNSAIVLYDYKFYMKSFDDSEAASL